VLQWNGTWEKYFGFEQMLSIGVASTHGINLMRTETSPSSNTSAYELINE
jgi:hypothetical protein